MRHLGCPFYVRRRSEPVAQIVEWFFGRGLSIGCGLTWSVPHEWSELPREDQVARIKSALRAEMRAPGVDVADIRAFLEILATRTVAPWRHQFHTTNWDYLLQREILELNLAVQPAWCAETHVYHLNGTVEELPNNSNRSAFVLESDSRDARVSTIEGNIAYGKFIWNTTFVVVGMSFECEVDKYLLNAIGRVEDDLPIGESTWIILNPDARSLDALASQLMAAMPRATILPRQSTFRAWLAMRLPELQSCGAIAF